MNHLQLPVVITPTRAELGARCHRRHFLSDVLNRARYYSASLEFGSVIHAGAAAHWLGRDWSSVIREEWTKRFDQNPQVSQENVSLQMATAMMEHYIANAKVAGPFTDQGEWQRVDVEQRFEIPLRDVLLSFQCDRMAYNREENWLVVVDTKTAARLDGRWDRQWETSLQMKLYKAGAKQVFATGGRVDVVVEGVLKHVPSDIRYYPCPDWSDALLAEAGHNAYLIADMDRDLIEQSAVEPALVIPVERDSLDKPKVKLVPSLARAEELAVRFTPVNYMDCNSYNVRCPFYELCIAEPDERAALLRSEYFETQEETY